MVVIADEQADLRAALDKVNARLAAVAAAAKNFATPEPKVEKAGKAADAAIMTLKDAETAMNLASDTLRKGSAVADVDSAAAGAKHQVSAADIIAKARAALNQSSAELAKDQAPALNAAAAKQRETQAHAADLQNRLSNSAPKSTRPTPPHPVPCARKKTVEPRLPPRKSAKPPAQ